MNAEAGSAYRPDIDGLRAFAVLAVILYHATSRLPGGFVGVDVFFVISGFLISTIILKKLAERRFSLLDFYTRRVKRIFPALALVLAACLVFGWFALYDVEYQPLGSHVAGGAAFVSNFLLSGEAGYFDSQSDYKELLHLWSLGVEEQFYVIFPLLLALSWRNTRAALPLILSLLVASFALNVWLIRYQPAEAFYWPLTRFWELMMGAAWAYVALFRYKAERAGGYRRLRAETFAWVGATLLLYALHIIHENSAVPGWLALLPTGSALLLIAAGPDATINRYLLSSKPFVFVGLISYPLYLWHWPILSFERILSPENPGMLSRALAVVVTFALAWLTYRLLELPVRHARRPRLAAATLCGAMVCVGFAGFAVAREGGFAFRAANSRDEPDHRMLVDSRRLDRQIRTHEYRTRRCSFPGAAKLPPDWCTDFGPANAKTIVLWGDSHAGAWSPVFYKIAQADHLRVVRFYVGGCPPLIGTRRIHSAWSGRECASFGQGERVLQAIRSLRPSRIFLVARWSLYTPTKIEAEPGAVKETHGSHNVLASRLLATVRALPSQTPITIFRTAPVLRNEPERALLHGTHVERLAKDYHAGEADADRAIDSAAQARSDVSVFDPAPLFCNRTCPLVENGRVLYSDTNHLSAQGALLAYDELEHSYFRTMLVLRDDARAVTPR